MVHPDYKLMTRHLDERRQENPAEVIDGDSFAGGFERGLAVGREGRTRVAGEHRKLLDSDSVCDGVSGPFKYWEHDHTALVHVMWSAKHADLNLHDDSDEIASRILRSRWYAAAKAAARAPYPLTSVAALDAVAPGHIIHSDEGNVWEASTVDDKIMWSEPLSRVVHHSSDIALPATTLFDPRVDAADPSMVELDARAAERLNIIEGVVDSLHELLDGKEASAEQIIAAVRQHIDVVPAAARRGSLQQRR